jgi:NitT/TauT family transport system substrate-binding protein
MIVLDQVLPGERAAVRRPHGDKPVEPTATDGLRAMRCAPAVLRCCRAGLVLLMVISAFGATPATAQVAVKFSLNWKFEGPSAPYVVALDRGYYGAQGLDVTIDPSAGSLEVLNRIATGAYDIGVGDLGSLIRYRDQNPHAPVTAVFIVHDKPALAIIGRKSRGVATPHDLEGKKLGAPATDLAFAQWPIFAKANLIDTAKVTIVNIGPPVREPMLASGEIDAFTGMSFSSYLRLKDRGVPADDITVMLMADHGVASYGDAILVNTKFAGENPDVVKAFLQAFVRGLKDTVRKPAAAIESILRRNEEAKKETELERLQLALKQNILTPAVLTRGIGGIDPPRLEKSIDQMGLATAFKTKPKPSDIFYPGFLPDPFDRKME